MNSVSWYKQFSESWQEFVIRIRRKLRRVEFGAIDCGQISADGGSVDQRNSGVR
jgi:hypothetical protein